MTLDKERQLVKGRALLARIRHELPQDVATEALAALLRLRKDQCDRHSSSFNIFWGASCHSSNNL